MAKEWLEEAERNVDLVATDLSWINEAVKVSSSEQREEKRGGTVISERKEQENVATLRLSSVGDQAMWTYCKKSSLAALRRVFKLRCSKTCAITRCGVHQSVNG